MNESFKIVVVIDIGWPVKRHQEVYAGIQEVVESSGWESSLYPLPEHIISTRSDWPFDGMIGRISESIAQPIKRLKIPAVNVYLNSPADWIPSVFPDWRAAGTLAAEHLVSRGLGNLAYLGIRNEPSSVGQWAGYREIADAHEHRSSRLLVDPRFDQTQVQWERFMDQVNRWVDSWKLPIGVCVMEDLLGLHLVDICKSKGLNIPNDVAILCSQNESLICRDTQPSLSSIDMGFRGIGRAAAEMLGVLMRGDRTAETHRFLPPHDLFVRKSTDVFAVDDRVVAKALRFISENSHRPIRVDDVAAHAAVSRRTLDRRFKEVLDQSVAREISRLRIERTKRQLLNSTLPIKSIAHQNGFRDASHLCTLFLHETGSSPAAWRENKKMEQG